MSPDKHFTDVTIYSEEQSGKVYLYATCENNFGEKGLYDIRGNEVIAPGNYEYLYITKYSDDDLAFILYTKGGLYGAYDLNGNLLTKPVATAYIKVYKDKIEIVNNKGKDDYDSKYIYGSYSEDTRFDYDNYDGLYSPFKSYASSSSNKSTSSSSSSSSNSSSSSSSSSAPTVTTSQLQPVQEWNPCLGCGGTGLCTYCQGQGKRWYGNSYENCITCHGSMYCQQCYGRKGYYTTVYR